MVHGKDTAAASDNADVDSCHNNNNNNNNNTNPEDSAGKGTAKLVSNEGSSASLELEQGE